MHRQPHVIRLRAPWQWRINDTGADISTIVASRWFHRPTHLEPDTRVMLVVAETQGLRRVLLNSRELQPATPASTGNWEYEITPQLQLRNLLELQFTSTSPREMETVLREAFAAGGIRLEIREGHEKT